jgi:SAM-dependent methyltransferase
MSFDVWIDRLFERWTADLTHQEIARALKALTRDYVQRRTRLRGKALDGRGKQAAFALYYAPRHFLIVREVLKALAFGGDSPLTVIDLGCGTGVAGAAWASMAGASVIGVDLNPDVLREAVFTWRDIGVRGGVVKCALAKYRWPNPPVGIVAAFTINELDEQDREKLWKQLAHQAEGGSRVLVIEPLATRITPWWQEWTGRVEALGGRADEWHFEVELPERVSLLGKSAGLNPSELGARTLWLAG